MNFALSVIVKTTVLLACASVVTLVLRRASASVKHDVWAMALLSALLIPIASLVLPEVPLPVLPEMTFSARGPLLPKGPGAGSDVRHAAAMDPGESRNSNSATSVPAGALPAGDPSSFPFPSQNQAVLF